MYNVVLLLCKIHQLTTTWCSSRYEAVGVLRTVYTCADVIIIIASSPPTPLPPSSSSSTPPPPPPFRWGCCVVVARSTIRLLAVDSGLSPRCGSCFVVVTTCRCYNRQT